MDQEFELACRKFVNQFEGDLVWQWDGRFSAALTEFALEKKDPIEMELNQLFNRVWDKGAVEESSDSVRTLKNKLGGLMPSQLLYTSDPEQDMLYYCAWWPWGDASTVSIRLSHSQIILNGADKNERSELIKGWFGI